MVAPEDAQPPVLSSADAPGAHAASVEVGGGRATVHRSPVLDLEGKTLGYRIDVEGADLTASELASAWRALDLPSLVADRYAFIDAAAGILDGSVPLPSLPGRLVLVTPKGFLGTARARERIAALRRAGARLALRGYQGTAGEEDLLASVGFVVVDAGPSGPSLPALTFRAHREHVRVLAENVATQGELDLCRSAGVDGLLDSPFGAFGVSPTGRRSSRAAGRLRGGRGLRASEVQCLRILHLLYQPDTSPAEVARVIETDPALALRVLHLVNSGAFSLSYQVDTVRRAVVLLGPTEIATLVTALALQAMPGAMDRLWFILARAMACEAVAGESAAYTVGMLSALAVTLDVTVDSILDVVRVSPAVSEAIAQETGHLGRVLRAVRCHEDADTRGMHTTGLDPAEVSRAYVAAVREALAIVRTMTREG